MRQQYFVLVLAHSLHGRLRRIQVPHKYLYLLLALGLFSSVAMFGMISSYVRMTLKVANYNSLRQEVGLLRARYQALQRENSEKDHELASLQILANEVSVAYGIKRALEGPSDISREGAVLPTYSQSLETYNFLRSANYSMIQRTYPRRWKQHVAPSIWPVQGRIMSLFGTRTDPFSGEDAVHKGIDIAAPRGTPIEATGDGIVARAEWSGDYGRLVIIDHGHGMETWYAHLSVINVISGQEIRRGEVLGLSGGTGRVTSPHLHYEVHENGNPVNPAHFLRNASVELAARHELPF